MDSASSIARRRCHHNWTSNPPPPNLTPFQEFTRNVDWEKSPLGPMDSWPAQLRQMVLLIVADPSPAVVYWGDEMTIVYNEAYTPLIGQKHPGMQGQDPKVGFADVWPMFDKIIKDGRETGEPHIGERQMLLFQRNGFVEETYYSWKFMPLVGEEGYVVASYVTVFELTREMIGDRRLASLQYMGRHMAAAKDLPGFWRCLLEAMEPNDKDMPLVMLYAKGKYSSGSSSSPVDSDEYILEGLLGIPEGHASAPSRCKLGADSRGIAAVFEKALNAPGPLLLKADDDTLPSGMFDGLTWRGFGVPSEEFLVNTIRTVNGTLVGIMFLGLNPMKKLDLDYQDHIHLVTAQIASPHVSAILLTEELRQGEEDTKVAAFQRAELSIQLLQRTKEFERSEDRFARFATLANVGVAAADTSGHLIYANPAFYEINGISPTSTEPMPLLAGAIPEDAHLIHKAWAKTLAGQPSQTFQIRMMKPYVSYSEKYGHIESEHMTGLCAVYPELDEQGNLSAATALIMDISELKWTEEQVRLRSRELEESEIKYKNFADHAPIGVGLINSESHMEYMNEAWFTITHQDRDDVKTRPWLRTVHPADYEKVEAFFDDLIACKSPLTVETRLKRPWSMNEQNAELNQDNAWILASGYAELNSDGTLKHVVCWITDISMQKAVAKGLNIRMNEAIELKRQQENFIDTVSHEIRNPMSAVLHCAEEIGASLTEYNATVSGSTAHRNPDAPSSIGLHERLQSAIDAAQIIVHCVMHQKRIIDDVLTLSKLDSDLLTISPIAVRPIETAQEALKLFEVELRTADIQWDIVEDQSLQDLKADWVLLDPSRLHQVLINLLTNAIKFTRDQARREISVKIAATKERPTMDSRSVYYLSQYGPRRNSRVKHDDNQGDGIYLSMAIKDTGKGLSADEKARLFKRFAQGSPKTYVQYGGSGLGLFISRQITEMMGGEIGVASEEGEGSTFVFFVKTQIASKPADSPDNVAPPSTTDQQSKTVADDSSFTETRHAELDDDTPPAGFPTLAKILIVEDNLVNQKVLNQALTSRGYVVAAANHGGEALEQLHKTASCRGGGGEERAFDVILMDIEMPVMGGIACMREIRNLEAQGRLEGRVTVIGVTANARDEHVKAAMGAGMDGVTTKPYRLEDLVAEMRRAYESRRGGKV